MRMNEIIAMFINMGLIVRTISSFVTAETMTRNLKGNFPKCATDKSLQYQWAGNTPAWFLIEVAVFIFYIISMVILMIKSRFVQVGID